MVERHSRDQNSSQVEEAVVGMYSAHPSPSHREKLEFASRRMPLRLHCCGISPADYVERDVLDAGCGTGEYSCWFAANGARVTGIDLSDGSLAEARDYAQRAQLSGVRFEKRSVLDTELPSESFDLIYCTGVLHHIADTYAGLRELERLLRPGGKILISLYNAIAFAPRILRRRIARRLGGEDLERRVQWGRRLFPFKARKLTAANRNDPESGLYDYFAIPYESYHTIGQLLKWFDQLGLEYLGSFPPARLRDYPAMLDHPSFANVEERFRGPIAKLGARMSRGGEFGHARPNLVSRAMVQSLWLAMGVDMWCASARKPPAGSSSDETIRPRSA